MAKYEFIVADEAASISLDKGAEGLVAVVGDAEYRIVPLHANTVRTVGPDGSVKLGATVWHKDTCFVDIDGYQLELQVHSQDSAGPSAADQHGAKDKVFAPMPGKIVKLMVEVGDVVQPKHPLVIVEAMKMENQVLAKAAGKVKAVNFAVGDQVNTETPIIELELSE